MADDIPARPEESPIRAAPVTVPVSPAAVAEILTEDGEITLPAGSGADDVTVAAARHLVDLVNGRVQPAGTPSFNSAAGTLTVPVPGSTVTISARNVTSRGPRRRPSRLPRARSNPPAFPASAQLPRSPHARLWGVGTNVQERLPALGFLQPSPFRPNDPAGRRPVKQASRAPAARPAAARPRSPSPAARPMRKCYEL